MWHAGRRVVGAARVAPQGNGATSVCLQAATWCRDRPQLVDEFRRWSIVWPYAIKMVWAAGQTSHALRKPWGSSTRRPWSCTDSHAQTVESAKKLDPVAEELLFPEERKVFYGSRKGRQVRAAPAHHTPRSCNEAVPHSTMTRAPTAPCPGAAIAASCTVMRLAGGGDQGARAGGACRPGRGAVHDDGDGHHGHVEVGGRRAAHQVPGDAAGSEPHVHGFRHGVRAHALLVRETTVPARRGRDCICGPCACCPPQVWCCLLPAGLTSDTVAVDLRALVAMAVIAMLLLVRRSGPRQGQRAKGRQVQGC